MGLSTLTCRKSYLPACHENSVRLLTHLSEHCDMSGPLEGIKILDLTTVISGPSATMLLADQGADVIKIESMHRPDHARGAGNANQSVTSVFLNNNRNKRALALDLKPKKGLRFSSSLRQRPMLLFKILDPAWSIAWGLAGMRFARGIRA